VFPEKCDGVKDTIWAMESQEDILFGIPMLWTLRQPRNRDHFFAIFNGRMILLAAGSHNLHSVVITELREECDLTQLADGDGREGFLMRRSDFFVGKAVTA
jgi:hypothetical protein